MKDNFLESRNTLPEDMPTFWWVCQGGSYTPEKGHKFLYAPNRDRNGNPHHHWENVKRVRTGDIIFNYANIALRAISIAANDGHEFVFEESGEWDKEGTKVDINHYPIEELSIDKIKTHKEEFSEVLKDKDGPFDKNGNVKQGYLFEINYDAAKILRRIYGSPFPKPVEKYFSVVNGSTTSDRGVLTLLVKKKQIILYGPPGTGKTYNTRKITVDLLLKEDL